MSDVFVSYSRRNQTSAEKLIRLLEDEGWDVWFDQEIRVGKPWSREIERALDQARAVIVLWTESAVQSEWVVKEATLALEQDKLFGVQLADCGIPDKFKAREMAMLTGWRGAVSHTELDVLFRSLAERVPPPPPRAPTPCARGSTRAFSEKTGV